MAQKNRAMPEMTYPPDLPDSLHAALDKQYQKGFNLYQLSCAKCHSPGSKPIPEFTSSQLSNYQMRSSKGHLAELSERKVSEGELAMIITFLSQIKR